MTRRIRHLLFLTLFFRPLSANAATYSHEYAQVVQPGEQPMKQFFGASASKYGDYAVVGAFAAGDPAARGAAYIYKKTAPDTWEYDSVLLALDGDKQDRLGFAVGMYETTVVVGALFDDKPHGPRSGSAYVFELDNETGFWRQAQKLIASDGDIGFNFGNTVAIWGDTIVVGSYRHNQDAEVQKSGKAYVFDKDPATGVWEETGHLIPDDLEADDSFAVSCSIHENTIICGAEGKSDMGVSSGAAYVFERDDRSSEWRQQKLLPFDGSSGDEFGFSVDVYGDSAIVGAPEFNFSPTEEGTREGTAYFFVRDVDTGVWEQKTQMEPVEVQSGHEFCRNVAIGDGVAACGAHFDEAAYVFQRSSDGTWPVTYARVKPDDPVEGAFFGFVVDIDTQDLLVGAYLNPRDVGTGEVQAGMVHFFSRDPIDETVPTVSPTISPQDFTDQPATSAPSQHPSASPSVHPSSSPSTVPSLAPSQTSQVPVFVPEPSVEPPNEPTAPSPTSPTPTTPTVQPPTGPASPSSPTSPTATSPTLKPPTQPSSPSVEPPNEPTAPSPTSPTPTTPTVQPPAGPASPTSPTSPTATSPTLKPPTQPSSPSVEPPNEPTAPSPTSPTPTTPTVQPPTGPASPSNPTSPTATSPTLEPPTQPSSPSVEPPNEPTAPSPTSPTPTTPTVQPPTGPASPSSPTSPTATSPTLKPPTQPSSPSVEPPNEPTAPSPTSPTPTTPTVQPPTGPASPSNPTSPTATSPTLKPPTQPSSPSVEPSNEPTAPSPTSPTPTTPTVQPPTGPASPSSPTSPTATSPTLKPPTQPSSPSVEPSNEPTAPSPTSPTPTTPTVQPPTGPASPSSPTSPTATSPTLKPPTQPSSPSVEPPNEPTAPSPTSPTPTTPTVQPPTGPASPSSPTSPTATSPTLKPPTQPSSPSVEPPNEPTAPSPTSPTPTTPTVQPPTGPASPTSPTSPTATPPTAGASPTPSSPTSEETPSGPTFSQPVFMPADGPTPQGTPQLPTLPSAPSPDGEPSSTPPESPSNPVPSPSDFVPVNSPTGSSPGANSPTGASPNNEPSKSDGPTPLTPADNPAPSDFIPVNSPTDSPPSGNSPTGTSPTSEPLNGGPMPTSNPNPSDFVPMVSPTGSPPDGSSPMAPTPSSSSTNPDDMVPALPTPISSPAETPTPSGSTPTSPTPGGNPPSIPSNPVPSVPQTSFLLRPQYMYWQPRGIREDSFGVSVAKSGNYALIGAPFKDKGKENTGGVYAYRYSPDDRQWFFEQEIMSPNPSADQGFGTAMALSGDTAIIGTRRGVAEIFLRYDDGVWFRVARVSGPFLDPDQGVSVDIHGGTAVAGFTSTESGAAVVLSKSQKGVWTQDTLLRPPDSSRLKGFATSVAVDDGLVAVGGDEKVYLFGPSNGQWQEEASVQPSDGETGDRFGSSIDLMHSQDLNQKVLIVGASGHNANSGAAYIFLRDTTSKVWTQESKFSNRAAPGDGFGAAVALEQRVAVVGAPDDDAIYVFTWDGSAPQKVSYPSTTGDSKFGISIDVDGQDLIVGAFKHTRGEANIHAGTAYLYTYEEAGARGVDIALPTDDDVDLGFSSIVDDDSSVLRLTSCKKWIGFAFLASFAILIG